MQKKKDEIFGFKLFVIIIFKAIKEPIKYAPLSPKKIFAFGKLKSRNDRKIIIWEIIINENSKFVFWILMYVKIILMIRKLMASNPLNPSIKLAPFITNKKQRRTKIDENRWLFIKNDKKGMSILKIFIGRKYIKEKRKKIIIKSLLDGLILIFISSKKPIKNIDEEIRI